nr:hypothetical protein [uncultured Desulfobacter sp.]
MKSNSYRISQIRNRYPCLKLIDKWAIPGLPSNNVLTLRSFRPGEIAIGTVSAPTLTLFSRSTQTFSTLDLGAMSGNLCQVTYHFAVSPDGSHIIVNDPRAHLLLHFDLIKEKGKVVVDFSEDAINSNRSISAPLWLSNRRFLASEWRLPHTLEKKVNDAYHMRLSAGHSTLVDFDVEAGTMTRIQDKHFDGLALDIQQDNKGGLYIHRWGSDILRLEPNGKVSTVFQGGGNNLHIKSFLLLDDAILVAGSDHLHQKKLIRISLDGHFICSHPHASEVLDSVCGICSTADGIWIGDEREQRIGLFSQGGTQSSKKRVKT